VRNIFLTQFNAFTWDGLLINKGLSEFIFWYAKPIAFTFHNFLQFDSEG